MLIFSFHIFLSIRMHADQIPREKVRAQAHLHLEKLRHAHTVSLIDFSLCTQFVRSTYVPYCTPWKIISSNLNVRVTIGFGKFPIRRESWFRFVSHVSPMLPRVACSSIAIYTRINDKS